MLLATHAIKGESTASCMSDGSAQLSGTTVSTVGYSLERLDSCTSTRRNALVPRPRMRNKPSIAISDDARRQAIAVIREYAEENLHESMGDLKASLMLDFILAELGPTIYNQAIADARAFLEERVSDLGGVCYQVEFPSSVKRKRS